MPIYEYQCSSCHHHFDLMQKFNDLPVTECPKCTEKTVIKLISAAGFQLKGTGWYATDFKNKPVKNEDTKSKEGGKDSKESTEKPTLTDSTSKSTKDET